MTSQGRNGQACRHSNGTVFQCDCALRLELFEHLCLWYTKVARKTYNEQTSVPPFFFLLFASNILPKNRQRRQLIPDTLDMLSQCIADITLL